LVPLSFETGAADVRVHPLPTTQELFPDRPKVLRPA